MEFMQSIKLTEASKIGVIICGSRSNNTYDEKQKYAKHQCYPPTLESIPEPLCRRCRLRRRFFFSPCTPFSSAADSPDCVCVIRLRLLRLCLRGFSSVSVRSGGTMPASRFMRSTTGPVSNSQSFPSCLAHGECLIGKIQSYQ